MAVQEEFIKSISYFAGLNQSELDSIRKYVFEKKVERAEIIVFEDDPAEAVYFVFTGVVKVYKTSSDGKEQILQIVRPGESFNDVPVFGGEENLATAEAMGPVVLNLIKKSDMDAILREYPQVAANVLKTVSQKFRHMVSLVEDLSFRQVTGRVAKMLLEYAGEGNGERPRLTQQEMAAMIGTAREMVGRSLKILEEDGIIKFDRHRIIITNLEALRITAGVST